MNEITDLEIVRERPGDVLPPTIRILAGATIRKHRPGLRFSLEASAALGRYRWPGNVSELRNVIERAVVLCAGDLIAPEYLPPLLSNHQASAAAPSVSLDDVECEHIARVMAENPTLEMAAHSSRSTSRRCGAGASATASTLPSAYRAASVGLGFDSIPLERRARAFKANDEGWTAQTKLIEKYLARAA